MSSARKVASSETRRSASRQHAESTGRETYSAASPATSRSGAMSLATTGVAAFIASSTGRPKPS